MEKFLKYLESQDLRRIEGGAITLGDGSTDLLHVLINPAEAVVKVTAKDRAAQLIVVRDSAAQSVKVSIEDGAKLNMLDVMMDGAEGEVVILQGASSQLLSTIIQLEASTTSYCVNLDGCGAYASVDMVQLVTAEDHSRTDLRLAHNSSDCTSRSLAKCVASGSSEGIFNGLVYVAQDAQRTSAEQNSRNILLSDAARIVAEPQLEIYADDVKCSHGATVGQMNSEAIYYMMQRGLSEEQARKLQLDGFVSEVTQRCAIEVLREALSELVRERLHIL